MLGEKVVSLGFYRARKARKIQRAEIVEKLVLLFSQQLNLERQINESRSMPSVDMPRIGEKESPRLVLVSNLNKNLRTVEEDIALLLKRVHDLGISRYSLAEEICKRGIPQQVIP